MSDESKFIDRLRTIERRMANAPDGVDSNGVASAMRARLAAARVAESDSLQRCAMPDPWSRDLFVAVCRRYGVEPFHERGLRQTTVSIRVPASFLRDVLSPQAEQMARELDGYLNGFIDRVIGAAFGVEYTHDGAPSE
jgi:hypothetical protein